MLETLQIDLIDECPLACGHCSNSSGPGKNNAFPTEHVLRLIREASILELKRLVLSGGEPLLHPGIFEILECAKDHGIEVTLFTTGITDKVGRAAAGEPLWEHVTESGAKKCFFSIYSSKTDRHFHNEIVVLRPLVGDAFATNEDAIRLAMAAGLEVNVHFIPSDRSASDLQQIYDWASDLGCAGVDVQSPSKQGRNSFGKLSLSKNGRLRLKDSIDSLQPNAKTRLHVSRLFGDMWGKPANLIPPQMIIRSDGRVSVCNACKYAALLEESVWAGRSLEEIWLGVGNLYHRCKSVSDLIQVGSFANENSSQRVADSERSRVSSVRTDVVLAKGAF